MTLAAKLDSAYDGIAEEYTKSKDLPFRIYVERPTLLKLIGSSMINKRVLDLACGSGYYSRLYRDKMRASFVYGVDISKSMIDIAESMECPNTSRIRYKVMNVGEMDVAEPIDHLEKFDVVSAAYLLCYAKSPDELLRFCEVIASNLKDGGKLFMLNDNPNAAYTVHQRKKYALAKSIPDGGFNPTDGDTIQYELTNTDGSIASFNNVWWPLTTYEWALRQAGFTSWRWVRMELDGNAGQDPLYWSEFLENCPIIALEATKGRPTVDQ
ncbi:S-adenosyl-L-methionine-dependent methyltransferase [Basidiobolus meristosporus CBS 931.73]|uniref:S-adenosyl-L-methionine-dependent methyltransferase n=1 Tax=Basidiobolus meristosporus CBS 931.73 TaxID=1314790 RepID=A0A1Y1X3W1_9FUNG|nr:S-adenosyl-L-methionine-dependent methyltransferase [Basidiobolus meristosporus CBS 931.73]|eukprot:ORX80500.1 S-adenosyl-L-methionine-dependent methyltransferase [Basidiobolus meristosporus CBS 931.73]